MFKNKKCANVNYKKQEVEFHNGLDNFFPSHLKEKEEAAALTSYGLLKEWGNEK